MARKTIDEIYRDLPGDTPRRESRWSPITCGDSPCPLRGAAWLCLVVIPSAIVFMAIFTLCRVPRAGGDRTRLDRYASFAREYEREHGHFPVETRTHAGPRIFTDCAPVTVVLGNEVRVVATICPSHERHTAVVSFATPESPAVVLWPSAR